MIPAKTIASAFVAWMIIGVSLDAQQSPQWLALWAAVTVD
jgi:hypothetical protein